MSNYSDLAELAHIQKEVKTEGSFFKVHFRGRVETMWGATKKELAKYLNKQRIRFSHIDALH